MATKPVRARGLTWTTDPPTARQLRKDGYTVVRFGEIRSDFIEPSRRVTAHRVTLDNAAASLLRLLDDNPRLAILGVPANTLGDLKNLYSFLVEPAFRRDVELLLGVDRGIADLQAESLIEPDIGYPWTFERLLFIAERYHRVATHDGLPPLTPIERQLLDGMRVAGLMPVVQYGIERFRVDFAFVPERLAVEADGRAWHDAERDAARDAHLRKLGWETIRFSGSQIYRDVDAAVTDIVATLAKRSEVLTFTEVEAPHRGSLWRRLRNWIRSRRLGRSEEPLHVDAPADREVPSWKAELDSDQIRAVDSTEGVVQVIAPAGSGKTRTMIARVQELISRGVPQGRILCTTFNKATKDELQQRLKALGITGVAVLNFHALGRRILKEEDQLRPDIGTVSYAQWRRLAKLAMDEVGGVWLDAPVASDTVSNYKLAEMITPAEAATRARGLPEKTAAEIYRLYEEHLKEAGRNDFDDLIISSVRLLQEDPVARKRWQDKWDCILVDEYQDIEPAQELLIQLVAAPEDSIFTVGDEDQCIYAWRRASVERIVMLDTVYPGLERTVLSTTYRCPPRITDAARMLIQQNKRRFNKPIHASPTADYDGSIDFRESTSLAEGAALVASLLSQAVPSKTVVLARTSRLLREVVEACINAGVSVRAPAATLRPTDAEDTVMSYLRLLASPRAAKSEDVRNALRVPNRYLPQGAEDLVCRSLAGGATFTGAIQSLTLPEGLTFGLAPQAEWGALMDDLSGSTDAAKVIHRIRTEGRVDKHYGSVEQMSPHDQTEIEALDDIEEAADGKSLAEVISTMEVRSAALEGASHGEGVELATIHGSKGREWDTVILFGADDNQMPHLRSLLEARNVEQLQNAVEDERRLAYVAITRTKRDLIVVATGSPSPFLREAGITPHSGSIPTLAEIERKRAEVEADPQVTGEPPPKGTKGNPPGVPAKYRGTCTACNRPIQPGAMIASNQKGDWVHALCA